MVRTASDANVLEASVPGEISRDANGHGTVHYVILPTALNGPVYWSNSGRNLDTAHTPRIVIDYEPRKETSK